jgi:hypothetical protein
MEEVSKFLIADWKARNFETRFKELGGMTPAISEKIGWHNSQED